MNMDRDVKSFMIIIGFGVLGILMAAITKNLNDNGILINEMITGTVSITDVMTLIILVWLIVGVMIALMRR